MKITDKIIKEALKLYEEGYLADLPMIREEGESIDLNVVFEPLWKACNAALQAERAGRPTK